MRFKVSAWDRNVTASSAIAVTWGGLLFAAAVYMGVWVIPLLDIADWFFWIVAVSLAGLAFIGLVRVIGIFSVPCSYKVDEKEITVNPMVGSSKRYHLRDFHRIEEAGGRFIPRMQSAKIAEIRREGTAGIFGYRGVYLNPEWGEFTAYATSTEKAVILLGDESLLVSPSDPEGFIKSVLPLIKGKGRPYRRKS